MGHIVEIKKDQVTFPLPFPSLSLKIFIWQKIDRRVKKQNEEQVKRLSRHKVNAVIKKKILREPWKKKKKNCHVYLSLTVPHQQGGKFHLMPTMLWILFSSLSDLIKINVPEIREKTIFF